LSGSPMTYYLSVHTPLGKEFGPTHQHRKGESQHWHGVGLNIYNDVTGKTSRSGVLASYSYIMSLNRHLNWSFGSFVGFQNFKIGKDFSTKHVGDGLLETGFSVFKPDLILGTWLYDKNWYVGISAHQLLKSELNFKDVDGVGESNLTNHYFVSAGVNLPISYNWGLVPSAMIKIASPAVPSVDLNGKMTYKGDLCWLGLSYRAFDSFVIMGGLTVKERLGISYSFDFTYSELKEYTSGGSHEIVLAWRILPRVPIKSPSKFW